MTSQANPPPTSDAEPHVVTDGSTVFLIDDDAKVRSTLSRALGKRGFHVRTFEDANGFLDAYDSGQAGCLVLDYGLPELNGLELQKILIEQKITIPIIFISGHGGVRESVQAMKSGAIDFLEKPFRQHTLIECITNAFAADTRKREEDGSRQSVLQKFGSLTAREQEIAHYMISNPSGTASKEIGRALDISPRTVDHHRARILEKMDIHSVAELIDLSPLFS